MRILVEMNAGRKMKKQRERPFRASSDSQSEKTEPCSRVLALRFLSSSSINSGDSLGIVSMKILVEKTR